MIFSMDSREAYIKKINELLKLVQGHADFGYISDLASQLIWFFSEEVSLSRHPDGSNFFEDNRMNIERVLVKTPLDIESLESAHFLSAKFLRELSYGSQHKYDDRDIVLFYLFPEYKQIDYKKVDEIRFGIPMTAILKPHTDKLDKIYSIFSKVDSWEGSLGRWSNRVRESEDRFQGVIDATNYLGLGKAFDKMLQEKRVERNGLRRNLAGVGLITLVIPVIFLCLGTSSFLQNLFNAEARNSISTVSTFVFSIALEALLLYYFRIIYGQWLIAKNHVMQLSLRHEMCAFVNEYAKSAKDMDKTTLAKFENLVFSELSADLNAPPSVYDAVDSIAKVIGSLK